MALSMVSIIAWPECTGDPTSLRVLSLKLKIALPGAVVIEEASADGALSALSTPFDLIVIDEPLFYAGNGAPTGPHAHDLHSRCCGTYSKVVTFVCGSGARALRLSHPLTSNRCPVGKS